MVADDWPEVRLGDLVAIKHGWPFKGEYFSEVLTGRPIVVNIGNFSYTGGFRFESTPVREYRGSYPSEYILSPGDILLVMTCQTEGGEILGIPGRIPDDGRTYLHNQRMGKVEVIASSTIDSSFLYWLFLSPDFNRELVTTASGTKILHTSPGRIEAFRFRLPSVSEQRAIAHILSTLDHKIELNRRMNETLEAMAQAIFKSWFVDFDLVRAKAEGRPPFGVDSGTAALFPDSFEDSAFGEIPAGWCVSPLDGIAHFLNGLALQNYPPTDTEYLPVIKIAELRKGITESSGRASPEIERRYIVEDGDVLFSWSGSLEVQVWCGGRGALNQHLFKVTSNRFPKWFFLHWLKEYLPSFQAIASGKATTMGHIQRHHLTEALVVVPPAEILTRADALIGPLLSRGIQNSLESRTLASIRDALLPKLLSGEIRVKDAERFAEVAV